MSKRLCAVFALILFAGALNFRAAANDKPQTWKGVVTLVCAAAPASAATPAEACRWTLFTPSDKKVYVLDPQERVAKFSMKSVTVTGTISAAKTKIVVNDSVVAASTIKIASIAPTPRS